MFSCAVFHGKSANCWKTTARSGPGRVTGAPPTVTVPDVGNSSPAAMRRHVVLPHPDGPTSATNSRSRTSNETWSSVRKSVPSRGKTRVTSRKTMSLMSVAWGDGSWSKDDLRRAGAAFVQVAKRGGTVREPALLDPREVAERAVVQRAHRGAKVCGRIRIRADQRDLGERELPHVDLARPVGESDVHHDAARLHRGDRGGARRGPTHGVDDEVERIRVGRH